MTATDSSQMLERAANMSANVVLCAKETATNQNKTNWYEVTSDFGIRNKIDELLVKKTKLSIVARLFVAIVCDWLSID